MGYLVLVSTKRSVALSHLAVGFLTLVNGCSKSHDVSHHVDPDAGDDTSGAGSGAGEAVDAGASGLCARFAAIQCDGEQRCCSAPTRSVERCQSDLKQSCQQSVYLDQIAMSPQSGFDASAADPAFTEFERRASRCDPSIASWVLTDEGLRGMFRGTLGRDQSCRPAGGATSETGIVAAALSACRHADGLACLPKSLLGDWTCVPKQAAGQSCITDDNCEASGACSNGSQPALGTCVARLALGAACTDGNQCESLYCDGKLCASPDAQAVYCPAS
jgi:hypothetical protein